MPKIKTKSISNIAEKKLLGKKLKIGKYTSNTSAIVSIVHNKSGQSCWCLLANGNRVCVAYNGLYPFMWLGPEKTKNGVVSMEVIGENKDNNPNTFTSND